MMKVHLARPFPAFVSGNPAPQIFLKKLNPAFNKEFQSGMSCYRCLKELEFHEIAGFNPNLAADDANRTNFCWENDTGTWKAEPVCDDCYWDQEDEDDTGTEEDEGEEEPLPVYSFCQICTNIITQISPNGLTDEELEVEMFSYTCDDCIANPSTPPITSPQTQNASPSAEQERSPSPSSWSSWSQP